MELKNKKNTLHKFLLISPLFIFIGLLTIVPIFQAFILSFSTGKGSFTFDNYIYILTHYQFIDAVINTLLIVVIALTSELIIGLLIALVLCSDLYGKKFFRSLILLPLGIPTIIIASNMRYFFDSQGLINSILTNLDIVNHGINWSSGIFHSVSAIVVADMWKVTPLVILIFIAGIESISKDLINAAKIDGASKTQIVFRIIIPLMIPSINMAMVIRGIDCFRIFETPLALFGRSFPVLSSYAYFEYVDRSNNNTSAAASIILFLMIILSLFFYIYRVRKWQN